MSQNNEFIIDENSLPHKEIDSNPKFLSFSKGRKTPKMYLVGDNDKAPIGNSYIQSKGITPFMSSVYFSQDERSKLINGNQIKKNAKNDELINSETKEDINLSSEKSIQNQKIDIQRVLDTLESMNQSFRELSATIPDSSSKNGGNGGDMGMLERRVESLEKKTEQIEKMVHEINHKMTSVETTIRNSSTKEDIHKLEMNLTKAIHEAITPLPKESEIKNIIRDVNKSDEIVDKSILKAEVTNSRNVIIVWAVGLVVAAAGIIIRII
ncbi:hypothetical protein ACXC7F_08530 [Bacillus cereus]|uniref:hypothetical protein n=1 Tax=Bacillus TaxID=1386 RepID=UPI0015B84C47|nr:hypothetical protein [Bacillus cereus]MDG1630112.1 hypothetical protein [Bacillus cereus]MDG1630175.1 hypothetical protein [Bacillus cereus]MDK7407373.1 hypothetical protein [Bacillus cereus]MDK7413016.1 hypothetical protein [Bacillus cereus]QLF02866.1 hypothetical protein F3L01_18510 [Bacillus cereus]